MKMHQKNNSCKKPGPGVIIAVICIVIYLFALTQAAVRIYIGIDERRITAEQEFTMIANLAYIAGLQGFMDERFTQTITSALNSSTAIEALIISGPLAEYAFEKEKDYAITWVNNSPRFKDRLTLSKQDLYMPISLLEVRNVNIKGVASSFDIEEIIKILRETLIIILAGFALSFFTILLKTLEKKSAAGTANSSYDEMDDDIDRGPLSDRSKIGWERDISKKLERCLHSCSSTESDLTFVLIELVDVSNDEVYTQSVNEALDLYGQRDMLFEYGRWGIAAIIPGINLEEAVTISEKYYQKVTDKYPRSFSSSALYIGITSRSGRLLREDRMILEAKEALKKAKTELKTSIVAFKSDPDKYREFIRKQK